MKKNDLIKKIEKQFSNVQTYKKQNGYFFLPRNRFNEKEYTSNLELCVHVCLMLNTRQLDTHSFVTCPISIDHIGWQMGYNTRNRSRKVKEILAIIKNLESDGVFKIEWFGLEYDNKSMFVVKQIRQDGEGVIPINYKSWHKIFFNDSLKDLDKENLMASLVAISSSLTLINNHKNIHKDDYSSFFEIKKAIGWENLNKIGAKINVSRKAIGSHLVQLVDLGIMQSVNVKFHNSTYMTKVYSRKEDEYLLKLFCLYCASNNLPQSSEYGDYSYLKITEFQSGIDN